MWSRIADILFHLVTLGIKEREGAAQREADSLRDDLVRLREKLRKRTEEARRGR